MSLSLNGWGLVLFLALAVYAVALLLLLAICRAAGRADEQLRLMASVDRIRERADRQRADLDWAADMSWQWEQIQRLPTYPNEPWRSE